MLSVLLLFDSLSLIVEIVLVIIMQCFTGIAFLYLFLVASDRILGVGESLEYILVELILKHFLIKDELAVFAQYGGEHLLLLLL